MTSSNPNTAGQQILDAKTDWAVLGLIGIESKEEITRAFRRLVLVYHPDKPTGNNEVFLRIHSAYAALTETGGGGGGGAEKEDAGENEDDFVFYRKRRERAGDEGLRKDWRRSMFDDDGMEVDDKDDDDDEDRGAKSATKRTSPRQEKKKKTKVAQKDADEVIEIFVTLEELYHGKTYDHYAPDGQHWKVDILPGYSTGATIRYEEASTRFSPGNAPGDVVFAITQIVHPRFKRNRNDLFCTVDISLYDALCSNQISVAGIDGRVYTIDIPADEILGPGAMFQKTLKGLGMPCPRTTAFGDLIVSFAVKLPERLAEDERQAVRETLRTCEYAFRPEPVPVVFGGLKVGEEMKIGAGSRARARKRRPSAAERKRAADAAEDIFRAATAHAMPAAGKTGDPEYGEDVVVPLYLTLEDLYSGVSVPYEKQNLTVNVCAGAEDGVKITYPERGQPGRDGGGDLVFVVRETRHERFTRVGSNLFHTQLLPLWRVLLGEPVPVKTLDGRVLSVCRADPGKVIQPGEFVVIQGEGMPTARPGAKTAKGDMHVGFGAVYPLRIGKEAKLKLAGRLSK